MEINPNPATATTSLPPAVPPAATGKNKGFRGRGQKRPRNEQGLTDTPAVTKSVMSQMSINETQQVVAVSVARLPGCVEFVSNILGSSLQTAHERLQFNFCHLIAVLYNMWLLVDKQSVTRYGFGPTIASRDMLMLHDITASFVEALSAMVLPNGVKLSTCQQHIVPAIRNLIQQACARSLHLTFPDHPPLEQGFTLEDFPLTQVLSRFDILRSKAARFSGQLNSFRVPDPKADFSLLASGVVINGPLRTSVGVLALPQRLEKVCLALALIEYDAHGASSFIPQILAPDHDPASLASRTGCFSGLTLTRDVALHELIVGMSPLARV